MKIFWALVALLVIAATVLIVRPFGSGERQGGRSQADRAAAPAGDAAASRSATSRARMIEPEAQAAGSPAVATEPAAPPQLAPRDFTAAAENVRTESEGDDQGAEDLSPFGTPVPRLAEDHKPERLPDVLQEMVSGSLAEKKPAAPADPADPAPAAEEVAEPVAAASAGQTAGPAEAVAGDPQTAAPGAAPAAATPSKIERKPDGTIVVNDRFIIKGEGTKAKPYEVTWDFLVSAQDTYKPRLGQDTLPDYLELVDGKWVRISGYIAFPLMAETAEEMLMMLNQWDGCCIGIPPTPYDAIEVRLAKAAEGETRFKVAGSVTGKLAVDPYLVRDWLIGLYTMDEAVLTAEY